MSSWPGIDFKPRSLARQRLMGHGSSRGAWALSALLLASALLVGLWMRALSHRTAQHVAELQHRLLALAPPESTPAVPQTEAPTFAQLRLANEVSSRLNLDWRGLLGELETLTPDSVAMLEIEPSAGRRTVRIKVETRTAAEAWAYVHALGQSTVLRDPRVLKHDTDERHDAQPVRFTIELGIGEGRGT